MCQNFKRMVVTIAAILRNGFQVTSAAKSVSSTKGDGQARMSMKYILLRGLISVETEMLL